MAAVGGWDVQDWFGAGGIVAIFLAALASAWSSWVVARRSGRQKIAEARLRWSDRYKELVLELDNDLRELERLLVRRQFTISIRRRQIAIQTTATEMLFMTNPDSDDLAAGDEYVMERDLLTRLARFGITVDMDFVRKHRIVMKHNWRQAKSEF